MSNRLNGVRQEHFKARAGEKQLATHRRHGGHGDAPTARAASEWVCRRRAPRCAPREDSRATGD
eukprot:3403965-Pleurochrysis_carterae.AAC.1